MLTSSEEEFVAALALKLLVRQERKKASELKAQEKERQKAEQGFTVCGISEALGDFEMDELENIFNGSDYGKYPMRVLYIDVEMAKKEAHP